jgi:hypothetical protein
MHELEHSRRRFSSGGFVQNARAVAEAWKRAPEKKICFLVET